MMAPRNMLARLAIMFVFALGIGLLAYKVTRDLLCHFEPELSFCGRGK
jgi:hypothetical protein